MSRRFLFQVDARGRAFCDRIADEMIRRFGISEDEALGRINELWRGVDFEPQDLRYHETEEYWANDVYFGHGSLWWMNPPNLKPVPYPEDRGPDRE